MIMMYVLALLDLRVRCFKLVGRRHVTSEEVCGPSMSYEPLGARAWRREAGLDKNFAKTAETATSRCLIHITPQSAVDTAQMINID